MRHTSIRLSEKHLGLILGTGRSSTEILKQALDMYFGIDGPEVQRLSAILREHERVWHRSEHKMGTPTPLAQIEHKECKQSVPNETGECQSTKSAGRMVIVVRKKQPCGQHAEQILDDIEMQMPSI